MQIMVFGAHLIYLNTYMFIAMKSMILDFSWYNNLFDVLNPSRIDNDVVEQQINGGISRHGMCCARFYLD